jgi:hypothetical protein
MQCEIYLFELCFRIRSRRLLKSYDARQRLSKKPSSLIQAERTCCDASKLKIEVDGKSIFRQVFKEFWPIQYSNGDLERDAVIQAP